LLRLLSPSGKGKQLPKGVVEEYLKHADAATMNFCAEGFGRPAGRFQNGGAMPEPDNPAAPSQPRPDPNEKLVKVFDSELEPEAMVVKGLLDSAGIDSDLTAAAMVQDMFPGLGGMIILVREEDAERARSLIAEQRQTAQADEQDTAEIETTEEPPQQP
jgi:hypothetical protein